MANQEADALDNFLNKRSDDAEKYYHIIEDTLNAEGNHWAYNTLIGIYEFIEKNNYITPKQKQAVDNIINARRSY